jgi:hypothetical protein
MILLNISVVALKSMSGVLLPEITWLPRISLRNALWHHTITSTCWNCVQCLKLMMTSSFSKMVRLRTMTTLLRNFLMRYFHGAGLEGADGSNGAHALRTWHPWIFISEGYVKQIVCSVHIHNIQHLKQRIREAAASVTPDVLGRVWQEMEYRLDVCRTTNRAPIGLR